MRATSSRCIPCFYSQLELRQAMRVCLGDPVTLERCPVLTPKTRCPRHSRIKERRRGTTAQRGYGAAWQRHSKERRDEEGECAICGSEDDLTVDHPTDAVWCRSCHDKVEARRRLPTPRSNL